MAPFAPYSGTANQPSYLGYSKEPDRVQPNKAGKIALEGIGDLFSGIVGGIDELNQQGIQKGAYKAVDEEVNADIGRMENTILQMANPTGTAPSPATPSSSSYMPEELNPPTTLVGSSPWAVPIDTPVEQLPAPIQRGIAEANKVAMAASSKKAEDVDFSGRIWARTKALIDTYGPGYRPIIEHHMSAALGTRGAAHRTALKNALDTLTSKTDAAENKYFSFIDQNAALFTPEQYQQFSTTKDPAQRQEAYFYVQQVKHTRDRAAQSHLMLEHRKRTGEAIAEDFKQNLHAQTDSMLSEGVTQYRFKSGDKTFNLNVLDKVLKDQFDRKDPNGPADTVLIAQVGQQLGMMLTELEQRFDKYVIDNGLSGLMKKEDIADARSRIRGYLDPLIRHVGEKNIAAITNELNTIEGIGKNEGLKLLADRNMRTLAGLNVAAGGAVQLLGTNLLTTIFQTKDGKTVNLMQGMARSIYDMTNKEIMATPNGSLNRYLENFKLVHPGATSLPTGYLPQVLGTPEKMLNDPAATPEIKGNVTKAMSHPDNVKMIKSIEVQSQIEGFATAYSPSAIAKVYEWAQNSPADWEKFKETAGLAFRESFINNIGYLEGKLNRGNDYRGVTLKWDQATNSLVYSNPRFGDKRVTGGMSAAFPADATRMEVDRLNVGLRAIGKIYEAEGRQLTPQLLKEELGINFNPNHNNPGVKLIQRALDPEQAIKDVEQGTSASEQKGAATTLPGTPANSTSEPPTGSGGPSNSGPTKMNFTPGEVKERDYGSLAFPISIPGMMAGQITSRLQDAGVKLEDIPDDLKKKIEGASMFSNLTLTKQDLESIPGDVWNKIAPQVGAPTTPARTVDPVRDLIRKAEASGSYDLMFGRGNQRLTNKTVDEVIELQKGSRVSSAAGGYQFLRKTLVGLKEELGLTGKERFNEDLQDRLAQALMERRGLNEYLQGKITKEQFADRLAQEWAGLPTSSGKSHYEGDGLNKATVSRRALMQAIEKFTKTRTSSL